MPHSQQRQSTGANFILITAKQHLAVLAQRSVALGANVRPATPPCPRTQPTREWGAPQHEYGVEPQPKMNSVHFKRNRTPVMDGYRELQSI